MFEGIAIKQISASRISRRGPKYLRLKVDLIWGQDRFNLFKRWSWYVVVRFGWEEANQRNDPPRWNGDFSK